MDFYSVTCKKQYKEQDSDKWVDAAGNSQKLIILADTLDEAKEKIQYCLNEMAVERHGYQTRYLPVGHVTKCVGLALGQGVSGNFYCDVIV